MQLMKDGPLAVQNSSMSDSASIQNRSQREARASLPEAQNESPIWRNDLDLLAVFQAQRQLYGHNTYR
jgi:hypothetical protein